MRHKVNKRRSAGQFNQNTRRTKAINNNPRNMRGGIRL